MVPATKHGKRNLPLGPARLSDISHAILYFKGQIGHHRGALHGALPDPNPIKRNLTYESPSSPDRRRGSGHIHFGAGLYDDP